MPLFVCDNCGCIENTATSNFWTRRSGSQKLCLKCDKSKDGMFPGGKHHGLFKRIKATAEQIANTDESGLIRRD